VKIASSLPELVGNTPLVRLSRLNPVGQADVVAKLEYFNPAGSVKDRIGIAMIEAAEHEGKIQPGKTVLIEPTSGNTGVGLAFVAAVKGYRLILTMPEKASLERRMLPLAYGAEVQLTPSLMGMKGAVARAEELLRETPNGFILHQFDNPANPAIHFATTGPEIWNDTDGKADILVCCVGSGGTITGISRYLKALKPDFRTVAVEPVDNASLSDGKQGWHDIPGIGVNFMPGVLQRDLIDEVITVTGEEAIKTTRRLAKEEGILVGVSSGAAVYGALLLAQRSENAGKLIVAIVSDLGERYLASNFYRQLRQEALVLPVRAPDADFTSAVV
jgi:cysteine synthase